MKRLSLVLSLFLGALLLSGGGAAAQMYMSDLDANADSQLDMDEFTRAHDDMHHADYDADGDGMVSRDEFRTGEFRRWDENGDGMMDAGEYGMYRQHRMRMDD
jgi:Ca2+-binding EF-hand superfamily protein